MEGIEVFKKLGKACDDVVKAYESGNETEIENALGRFMLLMIQMDSIS